MAAQPPSRQRHRARPGSVDRPVNSRMYRGTWLLVGIPLLIAAFSVAQPQAPCRSRACRPISTASRRLRPRRTSRTSFPTGLRARKRRPEQRPPGSSDSSPSTGCRRNVDRFHAKIPGRGSVQLENVLAFRQGRSNDVIVGRRAPRQLRRRGRVRTTTPPERRRCSSSPASTRRRRRHRGRRRQVTRSSSSRPTAARSEALAPRTLRRTPGTGPRRRGDQPRRDRGRRASAPRVSEPIGPARRLRSSSGRRPQRIVEQARTEPTSSSPLAQLVDLAFPFSLYEQAPFVDRGVAAITLTSAGDRPPPAFGDTRPERKAAGADRASGAGAPAARSTRASRAGRGHIELRLPRLTDRARAGRSSSSSVQRCCRAWR